MSSLTEEVQRGYERGWSYTPLRDGKFPCLKAWQKRPRATLKQSIAWAQTGNVGVRTGTASGIVVVDLDAGVSPKLDLPVTVTAITGGGGRHLYYKASPGESKLKNWVGQLGDHIDIRTDGGQVVSVGSIHPNGETYTWEDGLSPDDIDFAVCPEDLLATLYQEHQATKNAARSKAAAATRRPVQVGGANGRVSRYATAALDKEISRVRAAAKGTRNATLNRAAFSLGQLVGGGELVEADVEAELLNAANSWVGDDCTEDENRKTVRSGMQDGKRQPRSAPVRDNRRDERPAAPVPVDVPQDDAEPHSEAERPAEGERAAPTAEPQQRAQGYVLIPGPHTTDNGEYIEIGTNRFANAVITRIPLERIYRMGDVPGEIVGAAGARKFRLLANAKLRMVIDAHMRLGKWTMKRVGKEYEPALVFVACSVDHGALALEHAATAESVRELAMLVNYPVVLPGYVPAAPEWNAAGGVFYDQPPELAHLEPETDTEVIRQTLDNLIVDFPFKDEASRQNFIGLLLTPLLRPALQANVPMHLVMAPLERTGKTKLIEQVLGGIILGTKTPALQLSGSEEERDKRVLSILLRGDTLTHLDNIRDELDSASLASLLTATRYQGRLLGSSKMVDVPNNLTMVGSGNNVQATGEIAKRSIPIWLQPADDRPEARRDFQHPDLPLYVAHVRALVLSSLIGMVRLWQANKSPDGPVTLGGFERWSRCVGGILGVCGYTQWMKNYEAWVQSADTAGADLRAFVSAWAKDNDRPKSTKALMVIANELDLFPDCFALPTPRGQQTSFARRVLSPNVNRPVGDWVVRRFGCGNNALYYLSGPGNLINSGTGETGGET